MAFGHLAADVAPSSDYVCSVHAGLFGIRIEQLQMTSEPALLPPARPEAAARLGPLARARETVPSRAPEPGGASLRT